MPYFSQFKITLLLFAAVLFLYDSEASECCNVTEECFINVIAIISDDGPTSIILHNEGNGKTFQFGCCYDMTFIPFFRRTYEECH